MGRRDKERKLRVLSGQEQGHRQRIERELLFRELEVVEDEDGSWTALGGMMGGKGVFSFRDKE